MIRRNLKKSTIYFILLLAYIGNIGSFMWNISSEYYLYLDDVNRFSFWDYCFHNGASSVIMFLLPILICFISLSDFAAKMKGTCLKNHLLRQDYKLFLKKEIIVGYLKSMIPFLLFSLGLFFIGSLLFKGEITNLKYADLFSGFTYNNLYSPYHHVFFSMILLVVFIGLIVNIAFIIYRFIKNYHITIILTFICLNLLNYLVSNPLFEISRHLTGEIAEMFENFNLYSGYSGRYFIHFDFLVIFILFVISFIVVILSYRNKEKVVMSFE